MSVTRVDSSPSLAVGQLPAAHALRQPLGVAMQEEAPDAAPDVKAVGIKGSSLNLNKEDLALRNEKVRAIAEIFSRV